MLEIAAIPPLIRQHAEGAAFLFVQRANEISGPSFGEVDLGRLDQRLAAHFAGLHAAGRTGWDIALEQFGEFPGAGEAFVLLSLALVDGDAARVADALAAADAAPDPRVQGGLSGAVAWVARDILKPWVADWMVAAAPEHRVLGLAALSHHRLDPGKRLQAMLDDSDPEVRGRAARLAFELGRVDVAPRLTDAAGFWPAMALARFGRLEALDPFFADPGESRAGLALDARLLARPEAARELLRELLRRDDTRALAVSRVGVVQDRSILPWLTRQMEEPDLAEAAGRAFQDIFPIDVNDTDLFTANPDALGEGFAGRDPGAFPVAARVRDWVEAGAVVEPEFTSLRRLMLRALGNAMRAPSDPFANWRGRRSYPAWV